MSLALHFGAWTIYGAKQRKVVRRPRISCMHLVITIDREEKEKARIRYKNLRKKRRKGRKRVDAKKSFSGVGE